MPIPPPHRGPVFINFQIAQLTRPTTNLIHRRPVDAAKQPTSRLGCTLAQLHYLQLKCQCYVISEKHVVAASSWLASLFVTPVHRILAAAIHKTFADLANTVKQTI